MARFIKDRSEVRGLTPGSLFLLGDKMMEDPIIRMMQYDSENLMEKELSTLEEGFDLINDKSVTWINIYGIHDMNLIKRIGEIFNLPSLLLENVLNTDQRPKYENGDSYDAFIMKMLHHDTESERLLAEQISIIVGENYVLTLQERVGDVFNPLRHRIRNIKGKVRLNSSDYLAYALMDIIVDNYAILIGNLGAKVEDLEDKIFLSRDVKTIEEIYTYRTELNYLRKAIRPVLDMMTYLLRSEDTYFKEKNLQYLRDLNDLVVHSTDAIELYNSLISDQLNIYNANVSNRMNEVMKVLTIFASIFIPLTFIAGIYGMNFEFMPELGFKYSYPIFWVVVISVFVGLVLFFRKKKWF